MAVKSAPRERDATHAARPGRKAIAVAHANKEGMRELERGTGLGAAGGGLGRWRAHRRHDRGHGRRACAVRAGGARASQR
eukprot:3293379-Prymnesium_polylepis.1